MPKLFAFHPTLYCPLCNTLAEDGTVTDPLVCGSLEPCCRCYVNILWDSNKIPHGFKLRVVKELELEKWWDKIIVNGKATDDEPLER